MSNEPKAGMNLDPEMIAAYIDKRLTPEQRAAVEAQLANDPDSYAVLVETMKAQDALALEDAPLTFVPKKTAPSMRRWTIAAGLLAAAAALTVVVVQPEWLQRLRGQSPAPDAIMARLVEAVGNERYVEGRLTGGFKYGPLRSVTRDASPSTRELAIRALVASLQSAPPDAGAGHALGIAQLQAGAVDEAVATLEAEARRAGADGAVRSDLAAALIARGRATGSLPDFLEASNEAARALDLDGSLLEARFNKALALELSGSALARGAWDDYLQHDTDSPWAREARAHLPR